MRQISDALLGLAVVGIFLISAFFILRIGVHVYRQYEAKQWKQDLLSATQKLPPEMLVIEPKTKQTLQKNKAVSDLPSALRQHPLLAYSRSIIQSGTPVARWQMHTEDNRSLQMYRVEISDVALARQFGTDAFGFGLDEQGRIGLMALYPSESVECAIGQGRVWMEIYHYEGVHTMPKQVAREMLEPAGERKSVSVYRERAQIAKSPTK